MRLLIHGQLTMYIRQLTVLLHASLDPYNTTEEMEVTWTDVAMDWTNGNFYSFIPVSYTHLDVYKRQLIHRSSSCILLQYIITSSKSVCLSAPCCWCQFYNVY